MGHWRTRKSPVNTLAKGCTMPVTFQPVETTEDIERLAALASEIWHEYWPAIIGVAQTDYMVEQFQSEDAIRRDMAEHSYEYWFICANGEDAAAGDKFATSATGAPTAAATASESATPANAANASNAMAAASTPANKRIVGYTGGHVESETNRFFISKIYLLAEERGRGHASATIRFYENLCRQRKLHAAYLTVNKHNELGIRAYRAKGFETIDAVETDIGNGFVMDDYIMELSVSPA